MITPSGNSLVTNRPVFIVYGVIMVIIADSISEVNGRPPRRSICKPKYRQCRAKSARHTKKYCENAMYRRYNCKKSVNRGLGPEDSDEFLSSTESSSEESTTYRSTETDSETNLPTGFLEGMLIG